MVHIPIERAMELIAQRGLPARPQAGLPSRLGDQGKHEEEVDQPKVCSSE